MSKSSPLKHKEQSMAEVPHSQISTEEHAKRHGGNLDDVETEVQEFDIAPKIPIVPGILNDKKKSTVVGGTNLTSDSNTAIGIYKAERNIKENQKKFERKNILLTKHEDDIKPELNILKEFDSEENVNKLQKTRKNEVNSVIGYWENGVFQPGSLTTRTREVNEFTKKVGGLQFALDAKNSRNKNIISGEINEESLYIDPNNIDLSGRTKTEKDIKSDKKDVLDLVGTDLTQNKNISKDVKFNILDKALHNASINDFARENNIKVGEVNVNSPEFKEFAYKLEDLSTNQNLYKRVVDGDYVQAAAHVDNTNAKRKKLEAHYNNEFEKTGYISDDASHTFLGLNLYGTKDQAEDEKIATEYIDKYEPILEEISFSSKKIGNKVEDLNIQIVKDNKWLQDNDPTAQIKEISQGKYTTEKEVNEANKKIEKLVKDYNVVLSRVKDNYSSVEAHQKTLKNSLSTASAIEKKVDNLNIIKQTSGKRYGELYNIASRCVSSCAEFLVGIDEFVKRYAALTTMDPEKIPMEFKPVVSTINEQQISNNSPIVSIIPEYKGLNHGTIRNGMDNFSKFNRSKQVSYEGYNWATRTLMDMTEMTPQILIGLTGVGSAAMLGSMSISAGGNNFVRFEEEGLTGWNLYSTATFHGAMEGVSETITGRLGARGLKKFAKYKPTWGFKNNTKQLIGVGTYTAQESGVEGISEGINAFSTNLWDRAILGKKGSLWNGVSESFIKGASVSVGFKGPLITKAIYSPFIPKSTNTKLSLIADQIRTADGLLTDPNITAKTKKQLTSKIARLVNESNKLYDASITSTASIDETDVKSLIDIDVKSQDIKNEIGEVNDNNEISEPDKKTRIEELTNEYYSLAASKKDILKKYDNIPEETKIKNWNNQVQAIRQSARLAEQEGAKPINIREVDTKGMEEAMIVDDVAKITQAEGIVKGMREIVSDPASTREEVQEAQQMLNAYKKQKPVQKHLNMIKGNASNYGSMIPIFNEKGDLVSYDLLLNRETSIKDGMINTAAHEFVHTAFYNTLKQDPAAQRVLGTEIMDVIQNDKDVSLTQKGADIFNRRLKSYGMNWGEEAFAIGSELMADGDLTVKESGLNKLKGIWRRFAQNHLNADIKFDTKEDIKNFMVDYHKSIKNNKPSPAIARMVAKGAAGNLFEMARDPKERADQRNFSKAVELNLKSNPDLRYDFDTFVQNDNGSKKHENDMEFKMSPEFTDAYSKIVDSPLLNGLIQQGMTEKGLPPAALRDFTTKVKEKLGERFIKNYNLDKNDSLFGWLTGVSGGAGQSIIYRAKGDVMKEYVKEQKADEVSLDKPVGEAGTLADVLEAERSTELEALDVEDLSPGRKDAYVKGPVPVLTQLEMPNVKENVDIEINKVQNNPNTKVDLDGLKYKGVKKLLVEAKKVEKNGKMKPPTKASDVTPLGPLYKVLEAVAKEIGVDPKRILANQDLDAKQRKAAQQWIYTKLVKEDGSFDKTILEEVLPEGETVSGEATGIANTKLGQLYEKGERGVFAEGKTAAGKPTQTKRTDVTLEEMLDLFGINTDGSFQSGTASDGAIRALITSMAQLAGNQGLRQHALANGTYPESIIAQLGDGKAERAWSKKLKTKKPSTQEIISDRWGDLINEVAADIPNKSAIEKAVESIYENDLNKKTKDKITEEIFNDVSEFMNIDTLLKDGFVEISDQNLTEFLIEKFEAKQFEQGIKNALKELLPKNEKGKAIDPGNIAKTAEGATKQRSHLVSQATNIINEFGPKKGLEMIIGHLAPVYAKMSKIGDGSLTVMFPGGPVVINKDFVGPSQNRQQVTTGMPDFIALINKAGIEVRKKQGTKVYEAKINDSWTDLNTALLPEDSQAFIKNKDFKAREQQAMDARSISETMLDNAWSRANNSKDPFDMGDFALLTMSLGSSMESPLRRSANGEYIQDGIEGVIERGVAAGLPMKDIVRWEHMKSKEAVASEILGSYIKDGKLNPSVWDGYQVQVISVTADDLINDSGFKTKSTLDGRPRLYNKFTLATILKNPSKYPLSDIAPIRSMNPAKKGTNAEVVGQQWYNVVDSVLNTISPDAINLQAIGRTQMSARQFSKKIQPPKGITVLDFDDTLATTKSGVRAKIPNTDGTPKPGRKVVFLAGGAGSGKSNVVKQLGLEGQGFKVVNSDISLEWLKKNSGLPADMRDLTKEQRSTLGKLQHQSRQIAKDKMMKYRGDGNGVIIDGTGGSIKVMEKQVQEFKDKGYDVSMLFVETSLDVALDRNQKRKERSLLDVIVRKNHEAVQNNKKDFRKMFGDRFMDVNTDNLKQKDPMPPELTGKMNNFVSSYENRRLDAEQFATEGADILEQGGTFDFSEFNVVVEGQTAPLFNKALKLQEKFGNKDMFVLTARPAESQQAIFDFLKANGLNIPLKNITGLANSTPEAKALWMADKVGEGYNDFYFADDALQNVQAVQNMLDQFDVKSKVQQAKRQFSKNMNEKFNDIIEDVTGIESEKRFSAVKARKRGASKGKFRFFIPPSHEDFVGLLYNFMGKGEKGNQHRDFFEEALVKPLNRAYRELNAAKQSIANDYKSLNKQFEDVKNKLNKKTPDGDFIYQDAIRTYLWDKHGYTIPGLTPTDQAKLVDIVNSDPDLQSYAEALNIISKQDAYVNPTAEWETGDIRTDLDDATGRVGREQYFEEFFENTNTIFSPENLNKIEAAYGKGVREALEDILYRTKTGRNRPSGQNQLVNKFMNYLNGSVASTMFFNIRSAVLQQMSMVNFINYADNNIFAASKAFANQPQYWKDWATIFNSDFMKQRRGGIKTDVNGAELAASIRKSKNSPRAVIAKLLELGFLPTQIGDNIAIATGGASFYRNRVNKYIKEGLSKKEAESKAFIDFQALAEATQQSARPDMVSQQQASPLGKVILAFQNVTSQFNRLGKKAFQDIYNRRITPGNTTQFQSDVSNASRIAYYLGMQNLIFYGLQTALFSAMFDEDEDDKRFLEKKERMINGSIDSVLRGTGVMGAVVSTLKNMAIKWHEQRDKGYNADESAVLMEMLNVSPPLGIKARKLVNAERTLNYNKDVIKEMETFDIDNPMWSATTNYIESFTNIPVNRLYNKTQNVRESLDNQHSAMERALMFSGWSKWNLGIEDTKIKEVKEVVKEKKKIESKKKADIKKKEKKIEQEKINKAVIEENKKKSKKDGVCAAINKHGKRCSNKVVEGKTFCTIHEEVKQNETGKKSQCKAIKSDGKRCKMQTSSKSGNCYYHD